MIDAVVCFNFIIQHQSTVSADFKAINITAPSPRPHITLPTEDEDRSHYLVCLTLLVSRYLTALAEVEVVNMSLI